jgi:hypothetical protein
MKDPPYMIVLILSLTRLSGLNAPAPVEISTISHSLQLG